MKKLLTILSVLISLSSFGQIKTWKSASGSGGGSGLTYPYTTGKYINGFGSFPALNTDSVTEGSTKLFYTNARVNTQLGIYTGDVTFSGGVSAIGNLKVINAMIANGTIDLTTKVTGLLPDGNIGSAATWNAKQAALSGTVNRITITSNVLDIGTDVVTLNGTQSLTNKTIGTGQLRSGARTMSVNNTAGTANHTETPYWDVANQTYSGTLTWTAGTAPSGTANNTYSWSQRGNEVSFQMVIDYATAGATVTVLTATLPSDMPAPLQYPGTTGANKTVTTLSGAMTISDGTALTVSGQGVALENISGTTTIRWTRASASVTNAYVNGKYTIN